MFRVGTENARALYRSGAMAWVTATVYGDLPLGPVDWRRNDDLTTPEYARIHRKSARPQQHDPNQHRPRENHSETGIKHRGRARRQQRERYADSAQTDGGASNRREKAYRSEEHTSELQSHS